MNNIKLFFACLFVALVGLSSFSRAERRTRRTGRISQGLQPNEVVPQRTVEVKVSAPQIPLSQLETPAEIPSEAPFARVEELPEETKISEQAFSELKAEELVFPAELRPEKIEEAKEILERLEPTLEEPEKIELQFEDANLQNLIEQIQELFHITFISDEAITPLKPGAKEIKGHKISFKTQEPLTKAEVWNLFVTFLEIAGFGVARTPEQTVFRIQTLDNTRKSPLQAFIGVPPEALPDNNDIVRFVYFIENSTVETITKIVESLKSPDAQLIALNQHKAFLLTDKSYNIKTLMHIVKELDRVTMPQALAVLKLRNADAVEVKNLYETLSQTGGEQQAGFRPFGPRKPPTSLYFPENTKVIAEPRSNSLILLGTREAIKKIEEFIIKYVDIELDQPYSPLHTYQLKYASAPVIADIMNQVSQFGKETSAGKVGGVRAGDKYLGRLVFVPETQANRLIIRGDYNDYLVAKDILDKLDEPQPQVAVEILILSIRLNKQKELGAQIRSKFQGPNEGLIGNNVQFQTSGLRLGGAANGIVQNPPAGNTTIPPGPGVERLLGNLLNLISPSGAGNAVMSLGRDIFGVWGVLAVLESITNLQVISNPFVIATNKTPATVSIGETRRVQIGQIVTSTGTTVQNPQDNATAALIVTVNPQINSDGMIILDLTVEITQFTQPLSVQNSTAASQADTRTEKIKTQTIVANKEVLALGGLIRTFANNSYSKVPILGDIPILGWLFRNQLRAQQKDNLIILISTQIIAAEKTEDVNKFTQERIRDYHGTLADMHDNVESKDPIQRLFFGEDKTEMIVEDFIFGRPGKSTRQKRSNRRRGRRSPSGESDLPSNTVQVANREPSTIIDLIPNAQEAAPTPSLVAKETQEIVQEEFSSPPVHKQFKRRMPSMSRMLGEKGEARV